MAASRYFPLAVMAALLCPLHARAAGKAACAALDLRTTGTTKLYFVPAGSKRVYFHDAPDPAPAKQFVVAGDLLQSQAESGDWACVTYVGKGEVAAHGWMKRSDLRTLDVHDFDGFNIATDDDDKLREANGKLAASARELPALADWSGHFKNGDVDVIVVDRKGKDWRLNTTGIVGSIGTGSDEDFQPLAAEGNLLAIRQAKGKLDPCDEVLVGFNNAVVAASGNHCLGSGANHSFPQLGGVYWRQKAAK